MHLVRKQDEIAISPVLTASFIQLVSSVHLFFFTSQTSSIATKSVTFVNEAYAARTAFFVVEAFLGRVTELCEGRHDQYDNGGKELDVSHDGSLFLLSNIMLEFEDVYLPS